MVGDLKIFRKQRVDLINIYASRHKKSLTVDSKVPIWSLPIRVARNWATQEKVLQAEEAYGGSEGALRHRAHESTGFAYVISKRNAERYRYFSNRNVARLLKIFWMHNLFSISLPDVSIYCDLWLTRWLISVQRLENKLKKV